MPRDAPPSCAETTTSFTCRDSTDVNAFTSSGMTAPAKVPQEMITASFHHCVLSWPSTGITKYEITNVRMIDTIDVIHTSEVSGASKFISFAEPYRPFAMAAFRKYETALDTSIITRITKIHTSNCTWTVGSFTPSRMNVISATPVTP